jgi:hypothetical protein
MRHTMRWGTVRVSGLVALLALGASGGLPALAQTPSSRLYEMATETGMPHLEENLRYAVVREKRCVDRRDLSSAFWMLGHESLQDCKLNKSSQQDDAASYVLMCEGGHGTTGDAQWQFDAERIRGTLNVRLGGKNMTFFQRITGTAIGACPGG